MARQLGGCQNHSELELESRQDNRLDVPDVGLGLKELGLKDKPCSLESHFKE